MVLGFALEHATEDPQTSGGNGTKWDTSASMIIMLTTGRKHRYIQWRKHTQKHYSEVEFSECSLQFSSES